MSFRVEHMLIEADDVGLREDQVEVLECLSQEEALKSTAD
jgi:hypothetical protein